VHVSARTYFIRTFGCQMNEHDSERAAGVLETMGYRRAADEASADLVLFNTCAIRENADNKLYGQLSQLKPLKHADPGKTIVVGGCLAQKDQQALAERMPWVDVVYGTHNMGSLPRLLAQADSAALPVVEILEHTEMFPSALPARRDVRHHAWVSISIGCNNTCTFCIVPLLRGPEKSRRLGEIVSEAQALVADGVIEVSLLGQNVNSYGRDLVRAGEAASPGGRNRTLFAELLHALGKVQDLERIRFTSPHPKDFRADTVAAMAECSSVCEHIHLPVQSGSDSVLKRMKRAYSRRRYLDKVRLVRDAIPDIAITTDIIVGFPGETESEFEDTLSLVGEARYDAAYMFQYSPRPMTAAAALPDRLAKEVVQERFDRLVALQEEVSLERNRASVGRREEVLVEGASRKDATRLTGRTRTNKLVHFGTPGGATPCSDAVVGVDGPLEPGSFAYAVVTAAHPHHLDGELVASMGPARRLPLIGAAGGRACGA
jgi:tRNA-2-methylthio-N6-dimethylallyladenosine synthase